MELLQIFFFFLDDAAANVVNHFMFGNFGLTVAPRGSESRLYHNGLINDDHVQVTVSCCAARESLAPCYEMLEDVWNNSVVN